MAQAKRLGQGIKLLGTTPHTDDAAEDQEEEFYLAIWDQRLQSTEWHLVSPATLVDWLSDVER